MTETNLDTIPRKYAVQFDTPQNLPKMVIPFNRPNNHWVIAVIVLIIVWKIANAAGWAA